MIQQALIANTAQGPPTIQERVLARRTDPQTSKDSARKVVRSGRIDSSLGLFKLILASRGPLTVREASGETSRPDYYYLEFNRRVHRWSVAGEIEETGDVKDGGRVWRIA